MNLLLEICVLTFGWMAYSEASVPPMAIKSIDQLNEYYNTSRDIVFGKALFWGKLEGFEKTEQKLLMSIILDAYSRILTRMEQEEKNEDMQLKLKNVKQYLNKLKEHYFSDKHKELKKFASEVIAIKETDPEVQHKALYELKTVYSDAVKLVNPSGQNHRRRRQAKGSKKRHSKP